MRKGIYVFIKKRYWNYLLSSNFATLIKVWRW